MRWDEIGKNCGELYLTSEPVFEIENFLDSSALPEMEVINYEKITA